MPGAPGDASSPRRRSGPERFWSPRFVGLIFVLGAMVSLAAHLAFFGRSLFDLDSVEMREVDGGAMIPIDLFEGENEPEAPPEAPPEPPPTPAAPNSEEGEGLDAGHVRDAAPRDAAGASETDGGSADADGGAATPDAGAARALDSGVRDGPHAPDAGGDEPTVDAGLGGLATASGDAGADASASDGLAADVLAGAPLVRLLVNMAEVRKNPVGAQIGPLLSAIPQWDEFMAGTKVDPVRDTDWITISGPSLLHTERDVIMVHYSAADALVDRAIDLIRQRSHNGAGFDAGVAGVKATLGHADRAPRVFLRPQPHVVAVTPPDYAETAARMLVKRRLTAHILEGEAMRLTVQHPHGPFPTLFPEEMTELRVSVVPRPDGGADVHAEGRCSDAGIAAAATAQAQKLFHAFAGSFQGIAANAVTHGLLDELTIGQDRSSMKLELQATPEQLEALLGLVAGQLGVSLAPAAPSAPEGVTTGAKGSRTPAPGRAH